MAIVYNSQTKKWNITPEKTNYTTTFTPLETNNDTSRPGVNTFRPLPTNLVTRHTENPVWLNWKAQNGRIETDGSQSLRKVITGFYALYGARVPADSEVEDWRNGMIAQGWTPGSGFGGTYLRNAEIAFINGQEYTNKQEEYASNAQKNEQNARTNEFNLGVLKDNDFLNQKAQTQNQLNTKKNTDLQASADANKQLNLQNTVKNNLYTQTISTASTTQGGDYVLKRDELFNSALKQLASAGIPQANIIEFKNSLEQNYKLFYLTEKLSRWNSSLGATPPYGTFDPLYYKNQNTTVNEAWKKAVANDDVDITERYGENNYYWQHYTNIGKTQGLRGNKEEVTERANKYTETALTDKELQDIRDYQLGVDSDTITQRLLNIPEVTNQWTSARQGDPYWSNLAKEKYLDLNKEEDFAALFRLSDRPEDKQVVLKYNVNAGTGITQLEDTINEAIGSKAQVDVKKFAALNQNILKDTIQEMKKVKAQQEMMSFYRGFSGFSEVMDVNKELANNILGDTGVGGVLSYTSGGKAEENLLGALQNVTGMRSNTVYNWQQWFDTAIKDKYGIDYSMFEPLEEKKDIISAFTSTDKKVFDASTNKFTDKFLKSAGFNTTEKLLTFLEAQGQEGKTILDTIKGDPGENAKLTLVPIQSRLEADIKTLDEAKERGIATSYSLGDKTEMMNIEAQFARNYLDEYLLPRFNTSRSMDEFVEYLDVRQEEKNPFQTQDTYDSIKMIGDMYSKKYLDDIRQQGPRGFDPDFYFNPTGDTSREAAFAKQKQTIEEDWVKAKAGDPYWANQVYRFGIDVNNKAAFARMHFEVKGQGQGFDAADDITNASKIQNYLYKTVLPVMKEEAFKADPVFGQFITPEEFANEMLQGLDPDKTPDVWKEVLQRYGLSSFTGTLDELKQYIVETLRTGSAQDIREQIKFLNEKRQKPTQNILGVTYIDRPEDYKDEMVKPTTELYAIFQKSGYQGTENDFYTDMFPDLDRTEQTLLTKAGKDERLKAYGLDLSDPFASLGTIESFFPETQKEVDKETAKEQAKDFYTSYFKMNEDQEEEEPTKSKAGQAFLGEFTSMFKGI